VTRHVRYHTASPSQSSNTYLDASSVIIILWTLIHKKSLLYHCFWKKLVSTYVSRDCDILSVANHMSKTLIGSQIVTSVNPFGALQRTRCA
jgi:hypothetical protein